ncbi:MAG: MFS transporter [Polyangiaceae bacterium]
MSSTAPSPRQTRKAPTVLGLILALAMAALEATVVSTAMPTVIGDLGGLQYYAWVANVYLLASSVSVPLYGKLADTYGRRPILLLGIALFLTGSIASGAAVSMPMLIVARIVQGLGAGSMQPVAITVVGDIFDLEQRSRIQGIFGAAWGFFGLVGPLLGGFIVDHTSWRWVFFMNIPFGIAAALLLVFNLHERIEKRAHAVDWAGAALLTAGVGAVLLAIDRPLLRDKLIAGAVGLLALVFFVRVERRAREPVLPFELFTRPVMAVSSPVGAIIGGSMMGILTYAPLYVQAVLHGTPTEAGSAIAPMVIGWPLASAIGGRLIPRLGFRPLIRAGLFITACSGIVLAVFGSHDSLNALRLTTLAFGLGMGFANTALVIAVQTSVPWKERGVATASTMFFRTIGGALAVGVMGGVLNSSLAGTNVPPEATRQILTREGLRQIDPAVLQKLGEVLSGALSTVFWIVGAMSVTAFLVSLRFPSPSPPLPPNLRSRSPTPCEHPHSRTSTDPLQTPLFVKSIFDKKQLPLSSRKPAMPPTSVARFAPAASPPKPRARRSAPPRASGGVTAMPPSASTAHRQDPPNRPARAHRPTLRIQAGSPPSCGDPYFVAPDSSDPSLNPKVIRK